MMQGKLVGSAATMIHKSGHKQHTSSLSVLTGKVIGWWQHKPHHLRRGGGRLEMRLCKLHAYRDVAKGVVT